MKTLIGIDGSDGSIQAVRFAANLLSADKDEVVLYYAPPQINVQSGPRPDDEVLARMRQTMTDAVFEKARAELPTALNAKTTTVIGSRKPKQGLLVAADESRAEMIVVGARGTGPLTRLSVGSVSRSVVHNSTIPVLVVRGAQKVDKGNGLRVLLACNASEESAHSRNLLSKFTWPSDSIGRVITVIDSGLVGVMPPWLEEQLRETEGESQPEASDILAHVDEEREHIHKEAAEWCGELPAVFQNEPPIVTNGHASQEILKAIDAEKIDLVAVGARRLGTLGRWFTGSTSEHLLSHAPCSVLIVRQHEQS